MDEREARQLANRMADAIKAREGITLTADELLHIFNRTRGITQELTHIREAFSSAEVKVVVGADGVARLVNNDAGEPVRH